MTSLKKDSDQANDHEDELLLQVLRLVSHHIHQRTHQKRAERTHLTHHRLLGQPNLVECREKKKKLNLSPTSVYVTVILVSILKLNQNHFGLHG